MNMKLRSIFSYLFVSFIFFHFLIPQGSHVHFCCKTIKAKLCTLDEDNRNIENILAHFHNDDHDFKQNTSLHEKSNESEKDIQFTFLSSGDNLQTPDTNLQVDFIPCFSLLIPSYAIIQFIPVYDETSSQWVFYRNLTSRSPPIL